MKVEVVQGHVLSASLLLLRVALLVLLITGLGGNWVIEQPRSSLLFQHDRMQWLCQRFKACSLYVYMSYAVSSLLCHVRRVNFNALRDLSNMHLDGLLRITDSETYFVVVVDSSHLWLLDWKISSQDIQSQNSSGWTAEACATIHK